MKRYFIKSDEHGFFKAFRFSPVDEYVISIYNAQAFDTFEQAIDSCSSLILTVPDLNIVEAEIDITRCNRDISLKERMMGQYLKNRALVDGGVTSEVTEADILLANVRIAKFKSICRCHDWSVG